MNMKILNINKNSAGKIALALMLSSGSFYSCNDFTELNPLASLSETTAFTSAANIELAANGMYQAAAIGTYDPGTGAAAGRGYPFGAAAIEQGEMRGEDMINLQTFFDLTYRSLYTTASANNVNHWEQLYALINQANIIISGVQTAGGNGIIASDIATRYEAEARFLRALAHHELLIHFARPFADGKGSKAGVPYREKAINSGEAVSEGLAMSRGTVAESYAKLLADLDFAEANLADTRTNGIARATKGAAIALKTRVKLHMEDWAGVIAEGAKLGADATTGTFKSTVGGYELEADPETPFANQKSNKESMFSIANSATSNPGVNGALANMLGPSSKGARDLVAMSPNLYNASFWVDGDLRRSKLVVGQTTGNFPFYYTTKYRDYGVFGDWAPVLRYSEVLLNTAEAYARSGNNAQSLALLNAVRNRSVPAEARYTTTPADLLQAILDERRIEFASEGRRWSDIHRLAMDPKYGTSGIPAKVEVSQVKNTSYDLVGRPTLSGSVAAIPQTDFRFLWPIPVSEISINPTLAKEQNPGY
jgi:hypothetical protein